MLSPPAHFPAVTSSLVILFTQLLVVITSTDKSFGLVDTVWVEGSVIHTISIVAQILHLS
jgi:hypothetical protein